TLFLFLALLAVDLTTLAAIYWSLPDTRALEEGIIIERTRANGKSFDFKVGPMNRSYVPLRQIPRSLRASILILEDSRFYEHRGFDMFEIKAAIQSALKGKRLRGASTISQQLVKNLYLT